MADYEGRFTKFSRYALELVATERRRIRRCVQGLNVEIQEGLAAAQIFTFTESLEKAQRVESARLQVRDFHVKKGALLVTLLDKQVRVPHLLKWEEEREE